MSKKYLLNDDNKRILKDMSIAKTSELVEEFDCSEITVKRALKRWNVLRSYNNNGQYCALPSVVEFDDAGLWFFKSVSFSKYGNLTQTVIAIVNASTCGMTSTEICSKLKLPKVSHLTFFKKITGIQREEISNTYVYFSIVEQVYQTQRQNRVSKDGVSTSICITDTISVLIFAEKIKNPEYDEIALCESLEKQGVCIALPVIRELFEQHGIEKKN